MSGVWGMKDNLNNIIFKKSEEPVELVEAECQNCGKKVMIALPFYGCVFCSDCKKGESYETADAPEFKQRYEWVGLK